MELKLAKLNGKPEIFYSIQGEGKSIGIPAVFIRTSLCNLHCVWCDTDYTWNWNTLRFQHINDQNPDYSKFDKKDWIALCSVREVVQAVRAYPGKNVILTGGEPMLQQKGLGLLMHTLKQLDPEYHFEVETNGTMLPLSEFEQQIDQYNVSPKLENSNNVQRLREKPRVYQYFSKHPKAFFKFVVAEQYDVNEVLLLLHRYQIAPEKVWLMPEGSIPERLADRRAWVVEICKTHGFRFSDRLHVQIWGAKKGV